MKRDDNYIQTYSGHRFWPLDPEPQDVRIEDVAHALSLQSRWTGHTSSFLSVAQHSVMVSFHCDPADALWGLLHDASEAYLIDLARPVKRDPRMTFYKEAEEKIMKAVAEHFGLAMPIPHSVHVADDRVLMAERRDLLAPMEWSKAAMAMAGTVDAIPQTVTPWRSDTAESIFLLRFRELTK